MPDIQTITLRNFKGAEEVTIDISKRTNSPVVTLIGLNESGKTTILEGLSYFVTGDNAVSSLFEGVHSKSDITALIPIHKKAAFTGAISISAKVMLDDEDFQKASTLARKYKLYIDKNSFPSTIVVTREYKFEDSVLLESENNWDLELKVRSGRKAKEREYKRPDDPEKDLWEEITSEIQSGLPRIAYFPTFLVDMPARIYLKPHKDERAVNRYYRYVFQDILDSLEGKLSLEKHVSKRIEDFKLEEKSPNWISIFFGGPSKAPIDSVFQKISSAVTKEVLGSWQKVFQRPISAKSISIEWNVDTQKADLPYASFVVSDGESRYSISERSLGFRWFFSFLLFTAFKQASKRKTLFVFDEPAANLHAKAQAELLTSFSRIVSDGNRIVYSTHSHHMINPKWLSGAYIVENTALDYDSDDAFGLSAKPTNVQATNYRNFVSQHPLRTSYFQPVIEKLEYVTPAVIGVAPFVLVEGITDFYALKLVMDFSGTNWGFSILPGVGSGALGPQINLLLGRGEKFLVLLDDDESGKIAAEKYKNEWYLSEALVKTLRDLHVDFSNKCLEGLISEEARNLIKNNNQLRGMPTKKEIGFYFSEMCAIGGGRESIDVHTTNNFLLVLQKLKDCFDMPRN